ncbi:divergent polysaccharide deacetylase family protein [Rhodovulum sulfidophilum]|nr:divergent polysaccharide deacetylase family protein [Rhodovulum sulfidophilum]
MAETPEAAAGPAPETDPETVPDTSPETALDSETVPEIAADRETGPEAEPAAAPETVPESSTAPEAGSEAPAVLPEVLPPPGPADPAMPGRAADPLRPDAPLPMIGEKAAPVDAAPEATRPATPAMPGALALNAVPFRAPPGAPLLSLVLIDIGAQGLDRQTLLTFPFPVTFVLDPAAPDAEAAMAAYREAGYEVAVLGSGLADLAPEAAAARLGEAFDRIDGGIALVTPEEGGFEGDRDLSGAVLGLLEASGHGLVTADKGPNDALRAAEQAGLREAGIFQTLDDAGQDAETIQRMLNRAVLEARQNGQAVIVGHSHPETVTAIYAWALLSGPADAVLAPLSAVLRQPRP